MTATTHAFRSSASHTRGLATLVLATIAQGIGCAKPHTGGGDGQPAIDAVHHSKTYEVNPLNPLDLKRSLSDQWRCGGFACQIGETRSQKSFGYAPRIQSPGVCSLTSVHVRVESTITIPHWQPQGVTSAARRNWWSQIQNAVLRHERQHVLIAEDGGRALATALLRQTASSCSELPQVAAAVAHLESVRIEQRQLEFDRSEGPLQITAPPPQP